ncbi:MAG: GNAT family N-acetyltransferase [Balneolaceae bacterium]
MKKTQSIPACSKDLSVPFQIGEVNKRSENGHIEVKIITHYDDFEALEHEWNELAWETDSHIFQTHEWNRIWWKYFGTNKKLHIVAVYRGKKLAGLAPLFEDDVTLLGHNVYSCLRFLGSYVSQPEGEPLTGSIPYSDYLDFIIRPGHEQLFYPLVLQHFNDISSIIDEIILDEVSVESGTSTTMISLLEESNYRLTYKKNKASSIPIILLDSTWEAYLNSMNVKDRYNARRYYSRSKQGDSKAFKIEKIEHSEELSCVLTDLIRMHQKQWNSRGFSGTFSEKRMRNFFIDIAESFFERGWIEFNMAVPEEGNAKYAAVDVFMTYKKRVYLMHRGMNDDSLYRKQGPGNVLLYRKLHEAIEDGVKVFDMFRGSEEFKLRLATKINQNITLILHSGFMTGRMLPSLVKIYIKMIRQIRGEISHFKLVCNDKPIFMGITEYIQFLIRRIKYRFDN